MKKVYFVNKPKKLSFRFCSVNISIGIELSSHRNHGVKCAAIIHSVAQCSNFCAHFKPVPTQFGSRHIHYGIVPESPISLWKIHFIRILRSAALNSGHLTNNDNFFNNQLYVSMMKFAYCCDLVFQNCYAGLIFYLVRSLDCFLNSLCRIKR